MAKMEKVERTMALDDSFTAAAELLGYKRHFIEAAYLRPWPPVPQGQRVIGDR